jgi:hypothetical protein
MGNFQNFKGHDDVNGDLNAIKMRIPNFQGGNDLEAYLEWEKKVERQIKKRGRIFSN